MRPDHEIELKFLSSPDTLHALQKEPLLRGAERQAPERLRTAYFDTPDHDLKAHGIFLRVRQAGDHLRQSVKRGAGAVRGEWEHDLDRAYPDPDLVHNRAVRSVLRKKSIAHSLQSIFETEVERTSFLWKSDAAKIEVSIDRGEIKSNGDRLPISELELELKEGNPSELFQLAQQLVPRAALVLSLVGKGERGFLLAEGRWGNAWKGSTPRLEPKIQAGQAFKQICLTCLHAFMLNQAMSDKAGEDIELVHQSRIAIRRLRTAMSFFKPIAQDAEFDAIRGELKWISNLLGAARDLDVWQTKRLKPKAAEPDAESGIGLLVDHMEERRKEAHARLEEALSSERLRQMLLRCVIWLESEDRRPALKRSAKPIERYLDRYFVKRLDKLVKRGRHLDSMDEKNQHLFRIHAKKLRYVVEFFQSLIDGHKDQKAFKKLVGALEDVQSALGEIHDSVALSAYLADEFGGSGAPREKPQHAGAAFAAGVLAHSGAPKKKLLRDAEQAYRKLSDWHRFW